MSQHVQYQLQDECRSKFYSFLQTKVYLFKSISDKFLHQNDPDQDLNLLEPNSKSLILDAVSGERTSFKYNYVNQVLK